MVVGCGAERKPSQSSVPHQSAKHYGREMSCTEKVHISHGRSKTAELLHGKITHCSRGPYSVVGPGNQCNQRPRKDKRKRNKNTRSSPGLPRTPASLLGLLGLWSAFRRCVLALFSLLRFWMVHTSFWTIFTYPPTTCFQKCYGLSRGAPSQTQVLKFNGKWVL